MARVIDYPANLLFSVPWREPHLEWMNRSGGMGLSGDEQLIATLSARWRWQIEVHVLGESDARSYRAIRTLLKGRFNYLRIKPPDNYRIQRADVGAVDSVVSFSDDSLFSDDASFALAEPSAVIAAAAPAGAISISIPSSAIGSAMTAGVYFSVKGWLHHVDGFEVVGANHVLTFSPPLREAVTTSDDADFSARSLWSLQEDLEGPLELSEAGGIFGTSTLRLVEPVGRRLLDAA